FCKRQAGLCLRQRSLERPWINLKQQVALLHAVACFEMNFHQEACHASTQVHAFRGRYPAREMFHIHDHTLDGTADIDGFWLLCRVAEYATAETNHTHSKKEQPAKVPARDALAHEVSPENVATTNGVRTTWPCSGRCKWGPGASTRCS